MAEDLPRLLPQSALKMGQWKMTTTTHVSASHRFEPRTRQMARSGPSALDVRLSSGGLVGDQERGGYNATTALLSKGLENWGAHQAAVSACMVGTKEDGPMPQSVAGGAASYNFYGSHLAGDGHEIQAKSQLSQMLLASSPRSCVTTSLGSNMLDFSNSVAPPPPELRCHHHSDNSSEDLLCNSTATGSALKKARVQASSSAQSTLKVRKERLGDRITALHQIVSPFGKFT
ncbi:unnamed protein product [Triticum turgidum subsp. durum]|uniref:BHLH domain-containing protein n=1 Tax=Triticum turgidum subsp. durum TaxID=4567 RepID=A0A9R0Q1U3_TRITD|nr:unnamed protein product [Triticum turgidum subsp. durum]